MDLILFGIGLIGMPVCLLLVIVNAIRKKPKKKAAIGIAICFILFMVGATMTPWKPKQNTNLPTNSSSSVENDDVKAKKNKSTELTDIKKEIPDDVPVSVVEPKETETLGQKNALRKAKDYLNLMAFSKSGLIEQLEYEGFTNEEATYAVNKLNVDWKEQAVLKGKQYLDIMSFSRSGLIEQLEYEGFSTEEATYAVDKIGY